MHVHKLQVSELKTLAGIKVCVSLASACQSEAEHSGQGAGVRQQAFIHGMSRSTLTCNYLRQHGSLTISVSPVTLTWPGRKVAMRAEQHSCRHSLYSNTVQYTDALYGNTVASGMVTVKKSEANLIAAQAVLKAVACVHAPAYSCPHSPSPALALQGRSPADPVLHQQAHASSWVMPPLLHVVPMVCNIYMVRVVQPDVAL